MSVINQMLRDLDKGKNLPKPGTEEVRAVSKPTKNYTLYWTLLIIVLLSMMIWSYQALPQLMRHFSTHQMSTRESLDVTTAELKTRHSIEPMDRIIPMAQKATQQAQAPVIEKEIKAEIASESSQQKPSLVQDKPKNLQPGDVTSLRSHPINQRAISPTVSTEQAQGVESKLALETERNQDLEKPIKAKQELVQQPAQKTIKKQETPTKPSQPESKGSAPSESRAESELGDSQLSIASTTLSLSKKAQIFWRQAGKQPNQAESLLNQALAIDKNLVGARIDLIRLMISRGDLARAEFIADQGLADQNNEADLIEWKARLLISQKRGDLAEVWLLKAQPELLSHTSYYGLLAGLLNQHKKFDQAVIRYKKLVGIEPNQGAWWLGLAIAYHKLSQFDLAKSTYQRALQAQGLSNRSQAYIQQKLHQLETRHGN